jgi:hypothetical protein
LFCAAGIALCRTGIKPAIIFGWLLLAVTTIIFWFLPWSRAHFVYVAIVFWTRLSLNFTILLGLLIASFVVGLWSGRQIYRREYRRALELIEATVELAGVAR